MHIHLKYILYFLLGGAIVSSVTYFAGNARGLTAAFIANMPLITLVTLLTIYFEAGSRNVVLYAKGLVIMLIPWMGYICSVIFLTPRLGFAPAVFTGLSIYFTVAVLILRNF
jgi:hypothetical protein